MIRYIIFVALLVNFFRIRQPDLAVALGSGRSSRDRAGEEGGSAQGRGGAGGGKGGGKVGGRAPLPK